MASSDLARALMVEEVTRGTTPASAGQIVNLETVSIQRTRTANTPNVLRGDRRRYRPVRLQEGGTTEFRGPIQIGNLLVPLECALGNDEAADYGLSGVTFAVDGTANTITDSGSGFVAAGFAVGDVCYVAGFTTAANNGWHGVITAVAAGTLTFDESVGATLVTEVAGDSVTIKGRKLKDGTTRKSLSVEYELTDISKFRNITGAVVSSWSREWRVGDFAQESISFLGNTPSLADATIFTGGPTAALEHTHLSSLDTHLPTINIGGTENGIFTRMALEVITNARRIDGLSSSTGPNDIVNGSFDIRLTLDVYLNAVGRTIMEMAEDANYDTDQQVWFETYDGGRRELWMLPQCSAVDGNESPGAPGSDVTGTIQFVTSEESTYDYQAAVWRVTP